MPQTTILGIAGSARAQSRNWAIIRTISTFLPSSISFTVDTDIIPLALDKSPLATSQLHLIRSADLIIISTPQYNFDIPVILKQMLLVGNPTPGTNAWQGKLVAIIGASQDSLGTQSAVEKLKEKCASLGMNLLPVPPLVLSDIDRYFDASGNITDERLLSLLRQFVKSLQEKLPTHNAKHPEPKS